MRWQVAALKAELTKLKKELEEARASGGEADRTTTGGVSRWRVRGWGLGVEACQG